MGFGGPLPQQLLNTKHSWDRDNSQHIQRNKHIRHSKLGSHCQYKGTMVSALEQYVPLTTYRDTRGQHTRTQQVSNSISAETQQVSNGFGLQRHSKCPCHYLAHSCGCHLPLRTPWCRGARLTTPCKQRNEHTSASRSRSLSSNITAGQRSAEPQRTHALGSPASWECISPRDFPLF